MELLKPSTPVGYCITTHEVSFRPSAADWPAAVQTAGNDGIQGRGHAIHRAIPPSSGWRMQADGSCAGAAQPDDRPPTSLACGSGINGRFGACTALITLFLS